jgi:hypothetical protein
MDLSKLSVDPVMYEDGKRIEFGEDAHIRIRSAASDKAQKVRTRLYKPYETWRDEIPPEALATIHSYWLAQGLLTEFEGFELGGQPLKIDLTKEAGQKDLAEILRRPTFKALRSQLLQIALNEANFQAAADEVVEKNSESSAGGSSGGGKSPSKSSEPA